MSKKKVEGKTNAMRLLDAAGISYTVHSVDADATKTGVEIAQMAGEDPDVVFKTLVTVGKSGEHYVFMIPVAEELDMKKAAYAAGEKCVAMVKSRELFDLTGYVHGGCSPLGMKKSFPTYIDELSLMIADSEAGMIFFSGGRVGTQVEMQCQQFVESFSVQVADLVVG